MVFLRVFQNSIPIFAMHEIIIFLVEKSGLKYQIVRYLSKWKKVQEYKSKKVQMYKSTTVKMYKNTNVCHPEFISGSPEFLKRGQVIWILTLR